MFEILLQSIKRAFANRSRAFLSIIGISVGVAAVLLTIMIGQSGNDALIHEIDALGAGGIAVAQDNTDAPLTRTELENIRSVAEVSAAMPVILESTDIYLRDEKKPVYMWGIDQNARSAVSLSLVSGRFITQGDINSASKVCMVDEKLLSDDGSYSSSGRTVRLKCGSNISEYRIVGVIRTGSGILQNMMGGIIPDFIYVPYTTMQSQLSTSNFTQIIVKPKESTDGELLRKKILRTIDRGKSLKNGYIVKDLSGQRDSLSNIMNIFTAVLAAVGALSLVVAGMNIMNVMLTSVAERKREIGIKKSIGASYGVIVLEFLAESCTICLAGTFVGAAFAIALIPAVHFLFGLTIGIRIDILLSVIIFSVAAGTAFGIYPAYRAAKLKPADALRSI